MSNTEEAEISYAEDGFDAASPARKQGGPAVTVASPRGLTSPRRSVPAPGGLPVTIPESVLHPDLSRAITVAAPKTQRTRDTVIINRSRRGEQAQQPPPVLGHGADLSHFYKPEIPTYKKEYLDEVAYAESSKIKARAAQAKAAADRAAEEKAARLAFMGGRRGSKGHEETEDGKSSQQAFFDRQVAAEKARVQAREEGSAMAEYNAKLEKKVCPHCGNPQSYAEWRAGTKRCPKEACGGAMYRPKRVWSDVQESFLKRWHEFLAKAEENQRKDLEKYTPPFRVTHRKVFDKSAGEMVDEPIPVRNWQEVEDAFFARLEEVIARKVRRRPAVADPTHTQACSC